MMDVDPVEPISIWLDDERPLPSCYDVLAKTAPEAIQLLESYAVSRISLDHDLGDYVGAGTGYDVALAIERMAFEGTLPRIRVSIHTANPVGRQRMVAALRNAVRYWTEREKG